MWLLHATEMQVVIHRDRSTAMKLLDAGRTYSGKAMLDPANGRLLMVVQIYEDSTAVRNRLLLRGFDTKIDHFTTTGSRQT